MDCFVVLHCRRRPWPRLPRSSRQLPLLLQVPLPGQSLYTKAQRSYRDGHGHCHHSL
jgi:hypothetical protein